MRGDISTVCYCLAFTSLQIVIDAGKKDISDKTCLSADWAGFLFFIHPSIQPTTHSVLFTDRPGNQFGVWERQESGDLPFHPGQVTALPPRGLQVLSEPKKTSRGQGFEGPHGRSSSRPLPPVIGGRLLIGSQVRRRRKHLTGAGTTRHDLAGSFRTVPPKY